MRKMHVKTELLRPVRRAETEETETALPEKAGIDERPTGDVDSEAQRSQLQALAYQLWLDRGCPDGSPEEDWFHAERAVRAAQDETAEKPKTIAGGTGI